MKQNIGYPTQLSLRELGPGKANWEGEIRDALTFAIDEQLLDTELWMRLESQFVPGIAPDDDGGWKGEFWGKMMRGACMVYSACGCEKLYSELEASVKRLLANQDELGRIATYKPENEFFGWDMWSRKYVMLGMLYFADICRDDELVKTILAAMERHADYIIDRLGEGEGKIDITSTSWIWGGANSCSILEPMVRLYEYTGKQRFLDFASYIVNRGGSSVLNIFEAALNKKLPYTWGRWATKAYETMSCFEGLLHYACAVKSEKWLTAVKNFVDMIAETELTLVGSAGCAHELFNNASVTQFDTTYTGQMQETCVSVTWMKLCRQMLCLTGESRFADYMERTGYNAWLGTLNRDHTPKNCGMVYDSYSPLYMNVRGKGIGGLRILNDFWINGCCVAIASAGAGMLGTLPVMQSEDGLTVNSYAQGSCTAAVSGKSVSLSMRTAYPAKGFVAFTVETEEDTEFTLRIRIPVWSRETSLTLNGESIPCVPGTYAEIRRIWSGRTALQLRLDFHIRAVRPAEYGAEDTGLLALEAGPLVLARDIRLGEDISIPVLPENHIVAIPADAPYNARVCWKVREQNGTWFTVTDYASCGSTWDENSLMSAWLPTE